MVAFALETMVLMLAAYFLGAALACLLRRGLFAPRYRAVERRVDPLPEVIARRAEEARFGRATSMPSPVASRPAVRPATPPPPQDGPQDLNRIRLIDAGIEAELNKLGVIRYEQIADWKREDVKRVSQALGFKGRINQENWIEQAQVLAKGGETHYAARRARGDMATARPTADKGSPEARSEAAELPRPMARTGVAAAVVAAPAAQSVSINGAPDPVSAPMVAERAAFASSQAEDRTSAVARPAAAAVPVRPTSPAPDNLQRIGGITAEIEEALKAQGVSRYSQIAHWSPSDIKRLEEHLGTSGRIARENWVEQAQILARGGDTRFSREFDAGAMKPERSPERNGAAGSAVRTDLGSLRSVRSQAYRGAPEPGPEAAQRAAAHNKVPRQPGSNDLKRIRGIGVLIERKLNSMGVTSYDHIANWTADDIDRVSQSLDFKGRIERENWVEQARILSAGGQTEFSRRVDRGEVETSRAKT
jgi:predicted flap endonuclease-1-like 5' DNA nuclease